MEPVPDETGAVACEMQRCALGTVSAWAFVEFPPNLEFPANLKTSEENDERNNPGNRSTCIASKRDLRETDNELGTVALSSCLSSPSPRIRNCM